MSRLPISESPYATQIPYLILGLSVSLFLSLPAEWVISGAIGNRGLTLAFLTSAAVTMPFIVGLFVGGYWLERSSIDPQRYWRITLWCFSSMAIVLGLNIIVMFLTPRLFELAGYIQWGRFMACIGAGGGLLIGIVEARAIERERLAERAVIRAEQLAYQNDQLEFFNSILRHDVLNGMTVVGGRAEILYEELDDDDHRRQAETILKWSDDVVAIVQRVRSILNALTADIEPQLTAINLSDTIHTEVERLRSTYPTTTFEVHVEDAVFVKADELMNEVVGNLLTNAVEHNDPDGLHITITVEADDDTVTTRIADTGSGIPDDRKQTVFRRGETGHVKSTGSGFGLFFVDSMMTVYGGSIEVEDTDPHGTTFIIDLPRASEALRRESPAELSLSA